MTVQLDVKYAQPFFSKTIYEKTMANAADAFSKLIFGTGAGAEYLGWLDLPDSVQNEELSEIENAAREIRQTSDALVVVGIGGSYLGARAALDFLKPYRLSREKEKTPEIIYAGNSLSSDDLSGLLRRLQGCDFSLNVISKSGTTTEPAVSFRVLRRLLTEKYGTEEAVKRIYATTDREKGGLTAFAEKEGYRRFFIPSSVGGRYSVLSAVGLLPMAAAGTDIRAVIKGAKEEAAILRKKTNGENPALRYACARNHFYRIGKTTEVFSSFEPNLRYFSEWWKQLFGESEGKGYGGIFPASLIYTADLHSMGQYMQEGRRNLFETVLEIGEPVIRTYIPQEKDDFDGLNYLAGRSLSDLNQTAMHAVLIAHFDGGIPIIRIQVPRADETALGGLVYFFEFSCALSGYISGINPFDQPGVEDYKKNMFALLGKKGFELRAEELKRML